MCPIETPEGPNIGLIGSLSVTHGSTRSASSRRHTARSTTVGHRPDRLPDRRRRGPLRHRAGQRRFDATALHRRRARSGPRKGWRGRFVTRRVDYMDVSPAPDGVRRNRDDSVPRARRCQPRPDGCEHAASGGAAGSQRGAAGRYRHGTPCRRRRRRRHHHREGRCGRRGFGRLHHGHGTTTAPATPTGCASSPARTRAPAPTSVRSWTRVSASRSDRSSPTAPAPRTVRWPSARTCSSRSCRGKATTTRTRSS